MSTRVLDRELTLALLDYAVEVEGYDHTAAECIISDEETGAPVCLVGHVLWQTDPEKFVRVRPSGAVSGPAAQMDVDLELDANRILNLVQSVQDGDFTDGEPAPWGVAVEVAKRHADEWRNWTYDNKYEAVHEVINEHEEASK